MTSRVWVYVDYSNLVTEARHIAAVMAGRAENIDDAQDRRIIEPWSCEFPALLQAVSEGLPVARALIVTSDPFYSRRYAAEAGFELVVYPRSYREKEKRVDTAFALAAYADAVHRMNRETDRVVLVTGDLDQEPTVAALQAQGVNVTVAFWKHASKRLRDSATTFLPLNERWDALTHREDV